MSEWHVTIEVLPKSTGKGIDKDVAAVGGKIQTVEFLAASFTDATLKATIFAKGILTNPAVWQANIIKLVNAAGGSAP